MYIQEQNEDDQSKSNTSEIPKILILIIRYANFTLNFIVRYIFS